MDDADLNLPELILGIIVRCCHEDTPLRYPLHLSEILNDPPLPPGAGILSTTAVNCFLTRQMREGRGATGAGRRIVELAESGRLSRGAYIIPTFAGRRE
jgi:hypothetical protein